jgi:hypothetical protein
MKLDRQIKNKIKEFNPNMSAISLSEPNRDALIFENNCDDQYYNEE